MNNRKDDIIDVEVIDVEDAVMDDNAEVIEPEVVSHNNKKSNGHSTFTQSNQTHGNPYAQTYQFNNVNQRRGCGCLSPGCLIPLLLVAIFVPSLLKWSVYLIFGLIAFIIIGFFVLRFIAKRRMR